MNFTDICKKNLGLQALTDPYWDFNVDTMQPFKQPRWVNFIISKKIGACIISWLTNKGVITCL